MKNLNIKMLALLAAFAVSSVFSVTAMAAEEGGDKGKGPRHRGGHGPMGHWKKMADELSLSEEQREKIKEILKKKFEETKEEIEAVLTNEQKAKLEVKKQEWKEKHKGKGKGKKDKDSSSTETPAS